LSQETCACFILTQCNSLVVGWLVPGLHHSDLLRDIATIKYIKGKTKQKCHTFWQPTT